MQFGDDIVAGAADDARSALERKKLWKSEYHITRLHDERMTPLNHPFSSHRDPEEQATDAYDRPQPPPPGHGYGHQPDVEMGGENDVEMASPPGHPPPAPPPSRIMRDSGTGPDRRAMEEMGVQAGNGPPPPPPDRHHIGTNTENPRSDAGTQASFQPPPPPEGGFGQRQRRSRSPTEMRTYSDGPPPPQPPGAGGVFEVQRWKKEPEDVLMVSSSNGKPPPGGGGGMEVDRVTVRKRAPEMDIGEAMKDTAMAAARSRRQGELERKSDKKESMGDMQRAYLDQQEQLKRAAAEMARNHAAETRDLRHQRDVAVGAAERGRQAAAAVAPTIAYSGPEDAATIAYPQHFDISGRSRSPLLPTGSARSVSSSHSHSHSHDPKNDALSAYSKRGRGKSRK